MKRILPIILILSIIGFFAGSFMLPGFAKDVVKKKKQLDGFISEEQNLPTVNNLLEAKSEEIELLDKTFPKKEELIVVIQSVDTLAASSGVFTSLHFESEDVVKGKKTGSVIPISITIEGNFENIVSFITSLGKNRYLYEIDIIDGAAKNGLLSNNKVTLKGVVYVANQ